MYFSQDLRSHSSSFSDDVLRSPVRVKSKGKPGRPVPYHKHKALKMEETRMKEMVSDGWMDGWMNGWMGGWNGQWISGWME